MHARACRMRACACMAHRYRKLRISGTGLQFFFHGNSQYENDEKRWRIGPIGLGHRDRCAVKQMRLQMTKCSGGLFDLIYFTK